MKFVFDDGGRAAAGYKGDTGDCVCRSIAIATGMPYVEIYGALNGHAEKERPPQGRRRSSARTGVRKKVYRKYIAALKWQWVPTMFIGQGCKVHLRKEELPAGRLIVRLSKHLCAVVDGVIHDTHDPSREGTRCVYGYWVKA